MDEAIKEAFSRVKQDIFLLGDELNKLKLMIADMRNELKILTQAFNDIREKEFLAEKPKLQTPTHIPTQEQKVPTIPQITPTQKEIPTDKLLSQVLRSQNIHISTGNQGVPTNKQTNKQTNQQIIQHIKQPKILKIEQEKQEENHLEKAAEILDSLDALKKDVRIKFKRLTNKEMQVFSFLYQLESEGHIVDYPLLAGKLQLSEASIRDYIGRIINKGIPVVKEKIANKKIILHIAKDLKKIASLDTILKLREL